MVTTLFFVFLGIMVLGYIGIIVNFIGMAATMHKGGFNLFFLIAWVLAIICIPIGKLGAIITGIIWIVQTLSA